jgi:hypothetical protein
MAVVKRVKNWASSGDSYLRAERVKSVRKALGFRSARVFIDLNHGALGRINTVAPARECGPSPSAQENLRKVCGNGLLERAMGSFAPIFSLKTRAMITAS